IQSPTDRCLRGGSSGSLPTLSNRPHVCNLGRLDMACEGGWPRPCLRVVPKMWSGNDCSWRSSSHEPGFKSDHEFNAQKQRKCISYLPIRRCEKHRRCTAFIVSRAVLT